MSRVDEDDDGTIDRYELTGVDGGFMWWDGSRHRGPGGRGGNDPAAGWTWAGWFQLPWHAVALPK